MRIRVRILQLIIVSIPVGLLGWLLVVDLAPTGQFHVSHTVGDRSPYIERLMPADRAIDVVQTEHGPARPVVDEPAYISLHTPGEFERLELAMQFKNSDQPIVELGLVIGDDPNAFTLQPIHNKLLDELDWHRTEQDGVTLYQREHVYGSMGDFFANPPDRQTIATYHADLNTPYMEPGYVAEWEVKTLPVGLVGTHEFVTYVGNEPLLVGATVQDQNQNVGEDSVEILVYNQADELVAEAFLPDDGELLETGRISERTITLVEGGLPEGVYRVVLRGGDDIQFLNLETRQRYLSFVGSVSIGSVADDAGVQLFTDGNRVTLRDDGRVPEFLEVDGRRIVMSETGFDAVVQVDAQTVSVVRAESGGFTVTSPGKLAFAPDELFNPDPVRFTHDIDLDEAGINFVLARYRTPEQVGAWLENSAVFDLSPSVVHNGNIKVVFSAPGIQEAGHEVLVHGFSMTYQRPPRSLGAILNRVFGRL